jgi:uncharacterized RDD family membrane protein YckC
MKIKRLFKALMLAILIVLVIIMAVMIAIPISVVLLYSLPPEVTALLLPVIMPFTILVLGCYKAVN